MATTNEWVRVASLDDLPEGEMMGVTVGDLNVALYRLQPHEFYATNNICSHEFALLTDGFLDADVAVVECSLHAGQFDIRTGRGLCAPIDQDIATYETRIDGNDLFVLLPL